MLMHQRTIYMESDRVGNAYLWAMNLITFAINAIIIEDFGLIQQRGYL